MKKLLFFFSKNKFLIINLLIFTYIFLNLFDGNRGYFSYIKKNDILKSKTNEEKKLFDNLNSLKMKNSLLLEENINLDFLDQLYREYFTLGKKGEKFFLIK